MSIISDLTAYIQTLPAYADVYSDVLMNEPSIAVRAEPGSSNEMRDLTGARYGDFQYAIYCKTGDPEEAVNQLELYVKELDLDDFQLTERVKIKSEPLTQPHYVSKAENGEVIYTASFHIEYFEGVN